MALPNNFVDNTTTTPTNQDHGIKIAKPGYNVDTARDVDLVFSSAWPSLPVAFETTQTINGYDQPVAHGLTFIPFAQAWYSYDNVTWYWIPMLDADGTNVYVSTDASATVKIKAYNIDIATDKDYRYESGTPTFTKYDPNYGIKVAKEGKTVESTDLRDYILHSRCQSPLMLAIKTQATSVANEDPPGTPRDIVQFTTQYNYKAWVFGAVKLSTGKYQATDLYSQAYPRIFTNGITSYLEYTGTDTGASLLILRDPMFTDTVVGVTY